MISYLLWSYNTVVQVLITILLTIVIIIAVASQCSGFSNENAVLHGLAAILDTGRGG